MKESPLFWPAKFKGSTLYVLDETLLPARQKYIPVKSVVQAVSVIRTMKTRAFGQFLVVLSTFLLIIKQNKKASDKVLLKKIESAAIALNNSRPTFPFAEVTGMVLGWAKSALAQNKDLKSSLERNINGFLQGIRGRRMERVNKIAALIKNGQTILTHCNVSGELAPFAKIARRYHGIDIDKYERYINTILNYCNNLTDEYRSLLGIKSVDWLTLLGHELIEKIGGIDDLSRQLKSGPYGDGIIIHKLPYGICIQAGPEPDVGDVNSPEKEILPYYHHVGRILKPIHFLQNEHGIYKDGVYSFESVEDTTKWLQRFDN